MENPLKGIIVATVTPLTQDLAIDTDKLVKHCRWLLDSGCNGIALFGTTGEANSFSVRERINALDTLSETGLPLNKIIVGTGCCSLSDTVELTRHALQFGIAGVLTLPPFYYKDLSDAGIYTYFELVIARVADERLKIYLYNFPKMTGVPLTLPLIERLVTQYPGVVNGIKDSSGDWTNMADMCRRFPDFNVFSGTERYLAQILVVGGMGTISATANVTVRICAEIYRQWRNGKETSALQLKLTKIREIIEKYPMIAALKQILAWHNDDRDWLAMRPPNIPLEDQEAQTLINKLKKYERYLFV